MRPYSEEWHHITTNRLKTRFIVALQKSTRTDLFRCERHESHRPAHVPWGPDRISVIYSQSVCSLFYHTKFTLNVPSAWHPCTLLGLFHSSLFLHAPPGLEMPAPAANNAIAPYVLHDPDSSAGFTLLQMYIFLKRNMPLYAVKMSRLGKRSELRTFQP